MRLGADPGKPADWWKIDGSLYACQGTLPSEIDQMTVPEISCCIEGAIAANRTDQVRSVLSDAQIMAFAEWVASLTPLQLLDACEAGKLDLEPG